MERVGALEPPGIADETWGWPLELAESVGAGHYRCMDPHHLGGKDPMGSEIVDLARQVLDGQLTVDARQPVDGVYPVGCAIRGDQAVTCLAEFSDAGEWHHSLSLRRNGTTWEPTGGGASTRRGDPRRSARDRVANWASRSVADPGWPAGKGTIVSDGGGCTLVRSGVWPWSGRYLNHLVVRCAEQITGVRVGEVSQRVPWHGRVLIAWEAGTRLERVGRDGAHFSTSPRRPTIAGVDPDGQLYPLPPEP